MYYESMKDMFLDNRRGLEKELKGAKPAVKEVALNAYDWAVSKALEEHAVNKIHGQILGKDEMKALQDESCKPKYFNQLQQANYDYIKDVKSGRKVGYSAIEE